MPPVEIKVGQVWKDRDKRREKDGRVRMFRIHHQQTCSGNYIRATNLANGKIYALHSYRFGSGDASQGDSDLVSGGKRMPKRLTAKDMRRIIEHPVWPEGLEASIRYERLHDDHDGTDEGSLIVTMSEDGDAWVHITGRRPMESLRFRTFQGGGMNLRTRNALMLLAYAMKLDSEEGRMF